MTNNFTQKEMLIRVMDKLENIETKVNETYVQAISTNGKVKLHTKWIYTLSGMFVALVGWFISSFLGR